MLSLVKVNPSLQQLVGRMERARKTGRPLPKDRDHTNEARQPWLKLGMSRRTWYRRQAEKRAGGAARIYP
jgi:hypothetical protein